MLKGSVSIICSHYADNNIDLKQWVYFCLLPNVTKNSCLFYISECLLEALGGISTES